MKMGVVREDGVEDVEAKMKMFLARAVLGEFWRTHWKGGEERIDGR